MKNILILVVFTLLAAQSKADCGCESNAYMEVSYIDIFSNEEKKSMAFAHSWWHIDSINKEVGANLEEKTLNFMNKKSPRYPTLFIVKEGESKPIETKSNGVLKFKFMVRNGSLTRENIKKITKIRVLESGCKALPKSIERKYFELVLNSIPLKVKEGYSPDGNNYYVYRLGFELPNEVVNIDFPYGYDGGCA